MWILEGFLLYYQRFSVIYRKFQPHLCDRGPSKQNFLVGAQGKEVAVMTAGLTCCGTNLSMSASFHIMYGVAIRKNINRLNVDFQTTYLLQW